MHDPLGNPIGCKDSNTTLDLIEALGQLYEIWPIARVKQRIEELLEIVLNHMVIKPGVVHLIFTSDWKPIPQLISYAMCLQAAGILFQTSRTLHQGEVLPKIAVVVREILDHMLWVAWDQKHGGFHEGGGPFGPTRLADCPVFVPEKCWWGQDEGLRTLMYAVEIFPREGYEPWALEHRNYIDRYLIDHRHGGWKKRGRDSVRYRYRAPKSELWKDPSHETFALLTAIEICKNQDIKT